MQDFQQNNVSVQEDLTGWVDSVLTEADLFFEEQPVSDKRLFQILTVEIPKKLKPNSDI